MTKPPRGWRTSWPRRATWAGRSTRSLGWRVLVPVVLLLAGALFITSGINAEGTDLRAGRYTDLGGLLLHQRHETDAKRAEVARLSDEVNSLSARVGDNRVQQIQGKAQRLRQPVGLTPVKGPGLTVTLTDAPEEVPASADVQASSLVVHQQDIQAVANALWAGGAEAMTIQDQRVISTTGIKCVGNTVRLHGIPYAPPYVITAIGDPEEMLNSLNSSHYIEIYKEYVATYQLGYEVEPRSDIALPGYTGSTDLKFARPVGDNASRPDDSDL